MLVLSRKMGESIKIGDAIEIFVSRTTGNRVTLAIQAPASIKIVRSEILPFPPRKNNRQSRAEGESDG